MAWRWRWSSESSSRQRPLGEATTDVGLTACREYMICPLPRANEMSALRAGPSTAMSGKETIHGHGLGRRGADDETPRGYLSCPGGESDLVAGGRHPGDGATQSAALAGPV